MARDPMTLDEFKVKFNEIKARGFIRTTRPGPTGVGHTFETTLGYHEDNIALPDLGEVELKTKRIGSKAMITLYTYDRKCWQMKPLEAVRKYGTLDADGRLGMYFTLNFAPNSTGCYLEVTEDEAIVKNSDGSLIGKWNLEALANQFVKKFPGLVIVSALSEVRNGVEYFHYTHANIMKGTSADILRERIADGTVLLDLRLHDQTTRARNHGTGIRTYENRLPLLFSNVEEL